MILVPPDLCLAPPTLAVVPFLVGPLQALLALLPVILAALIGALGALFKPRTVGLFFKLLWRQKIAVAVIAVAVVAINRGLSHWPASSGGGEALVAADARPWPGFRGGPERRGWQPGAPDPTSPALHWTYRPANDAAIFSSPAVVGDHVFFATARVSVFDKKGSGELICLDARDGREIWRGKLPGMRATFSSPAVVGDHVVIGEGLHETRDARVSVFDRRDGGLRWTAHTGSHAESSPVVADGRVFAGAGRDGYRAFDLEPDADGRPRLLWHAPGERYMDASGSPNVHDGRVFVPMGRWGGHGLACLDADDGAERWRVTTPYPVFSGPTLVPDRGLVLIGMGNGNFVQTAEQALPGELAFLRARGASEAELAEATRALGPAGEVWAIDLESGTVRWKFAAGRTVLGQVVAGDDAVYFGSRDGHLYRLGYDGRELARWDARAPIVASPALGEAHVYVVTAAGILYGLDARSLRVVWEMPLQTQAVAAGDLFISSPVVAHGRIYVGTPRSGLLAIGTPVPPPTPLWRGARGGPGGDGRLDASAAPEHIEVAGFQAWAIPGTDAPVVLAGPVALHETAAFVPLRGGETLGLAHWPDDATPSWFAPIGGSEVLDTATDGARVFVSTGLRVLALDAATGAVLWTRPIAPHAAGRLLLTRDALFLANDRLEALDPADGRRRWVADHDDHPIAAPDARDGRLVVVSRSTLRLLDAETGRTLWSRPLAAEQDAAVASVCFAGPATLLAAAGRDVRVFSEIDGALLWEVRLPAPLADAPVLRGERAVAVRDTAGRLAVLDLADGRELAVFTDTATAPLVDDTALHFMSRRGFSRATDGGGRPANWLRWEEDDWGAPTAPTVLRGGSVFFPTEQGWLRATARTSR